MREIKFRAWDKEDKIMWESLTLDELLEARWELQSENGEHSLPHKDYLDFSHNETIWMQFTGLLDKNGKEIYEGDILMFPDTETEYVDVGDEAHYWPIKVAETPLNAWGDVQLKEGSFGIEVYDKTETLSKGWNSFWYILHEYGLEISELELIGNIYENQELLNNKV